MISINVKRANGEIQKLECREDETLYTALSRAGLVLEAPCGGHGRCGKCAVTLQDSTRVLACKTYPAEGMTVMLPLSLDAEGRILTETSGEGVGFAPQVRCISGALNKPSLSDQRSDADRLEADCGAYIKSIDVLRRLPEYLRRRNYEYYAVVRGEEIIDIRENDSAFGAAIDIGTTTVAVAVYSLTDGARVGVHGALNTQRRCGADVISRIEYAADPDGARELAQLIRAQINDMLAVLANKNGFVTDDIYDIVCVGNTTMICALYGLELANIAVSPFISPVSAPIEVPSGELGILAGTGAQIRSAGMISAYVGADTLSCVLAGTTPHGDDLLTLMIDIGTNGELVLGSGDRFVSCSTAAGPAFEGAHIEFGTGGVDGAIDSVKINSDGVSCTVLGGGAADGICGSGIVDAVAALLGAGVIDEAGRMGSPDDKYLPEALRLRIHEYNGKAAFLLLGSHEGAKRDIYVTQKDIRELQLAKSAIASGIRVLLEEYSCTCNDVGVLALAGGFGNYINPDSACAIGLLPAELRGKIRPVGNAALAGAVRMLLNSGECGRSEGLRRRISYTELSSRADFQEYFVDNMMFPFAD